MIIYRQGNMFNDPNATVLINTVNCIGVMGKGVALEFKKRFPWMFEAYKRTCEASLLHPGMLDVHSFLGGTERKWRFIINFPTKQDWRLPSQHKYITLGLVALTNWCIGRHENIVMPPLGCGHGGLNWKDVKASIEHHLKDSDCNFIVYEPQTK